MTAKIAQHLSLDTAFELASRNRDSYRWPTRTALNRLDPVYAAILYPRFAVAPGSKIFTIGGGFARRIETQLQHIGFDVPMLSPAGHAAESGGSVSLIDKVSPAAALQEIERTQRIMQSPAQAEEIIDEVLFPVSEGIVIDLELPGYVPVRRESAHQRRRQIFELFKHAFNADCVVIAPGSVEGWIDRQTGRAIHEPPHATALRAADDRFALITLDVVEVISMLDRLVRHLLDHGKRDKKILVAVCPQPLAATFSGSDVVIANGYGKATLRTALQIIADRHDQVDYFPIYEMATASLGYGIWEDDLLHVSERFVATTIEAFAKYYVAASDTGGTQTRQELLALAPPYQPDGAHGWTAPLPPELRALTDDSGTDRSPLVLVEEGAELGPGHAEHDDIRDTGGGVYSFWEGRVYFSTPDGSDPNTNQRVYRVIRIE